MTQFQLDKPDNNLRVGPLTNVEVLLRSLGCEPGPVFESAGLNRQQFHNSDSRIPYTAGAQLIAACVEKTQCHHFGLLLGQWFLPSHLGIVGQLAGTAPTVAIALRDIVDHLDLSDQGGVATLKISDRHTSFGYAINLAEVAAVDQIYDLSITNICGIMRALCGMHWSPERVHLSRGQPQNTRPYRQYFRAPIIFNGLESAIIFNSDLLRQPIATADPESRGHLIEHAHRLHDTSPPSLSSRLLAILRRNLVGGATTAAATADLFGLHERTLHRRLQAEGTSFRKLLDQVRQTVSQHYLTGTALPVSDIAMALGYSSTGAFDHAFRRWLGESPSKWREEHTATG